jgi:hypothetical protein
VREIYLQIENKLKRLRKGLNFENFKIRFSRWALFVIFIFAFVGILEMEFYFPSSTRAKIFFGVVGISLLSFLIYVLPALLKFLGMIRSRSYFELADEVGKKYPQIGDKLLDALQIYEQRYNRSAYYSEELIESAFVQLGSEVLKYNWDRVDSSASRKNISVLFSFLMIFAIALFLSPSLRSSYIRILNYNYKFIKPSDYIIKVEPGDTIVAKGSSVKIKVYIRPQRQGIVEPSEVEIWMSQAGLKEFEVRKVKKNNGKFEDEFFNLRSSLEYFVKFKDVKSEKFRIDVIDRPIVKLLKVKLVYPEYTGFEPQYLDDNAGDITAIAGTVANFEILANKELDSAKIVFDEFSPVNLEISGERAKGKVKLMRNANYHIELLSKDGLRSEQPVQYRINVIPDEYPRVEILKPGKSIDIGRDMNLVINAKITDDFGFTKLRLAYRLSFSRYVRPREEFSYVEIPIDKRLKEQEVIYVWDLSELELSPDDVVSYYLEVFDNDVVSGPKSARTEIYTVRFPSLHEILAQVEQMQSEIYQEMSDIFEMAKKLRKEMDEINKEVKKGNFKADWQRQQKIQNIAKQYDELRNKIKETGQKLQELVQKMEENRLLSPETLEKYLELQKLLSQLDIPELKELLKRFEQALQNIDPDMLRQALEKFQFSEENFRKSIERTLNLLKRIQVEQKLNEILKQVEQAVGRQEDLRKRTAQVNPEDKGKLRGLSDEQKSLSEEIKQIEKSLEDLKERMKEFPEEMPIDSLEKILNELRDKKVEQMPEKIGERLVAGDLRKAMQMQFEFSQSLMQMQSDIQSLQQQLMQNQQRQIISQMQKVQRDLLNLSKGQEDVKRETMSSSQGSSKLQDLARQQMDLLSGLNSVANSLIELSQKTFAITPDMGREIGSALMNMNRAIESLSARDNSSASRFQTEAMSSLNRAVIQLGNAMQALMQGGAGGGLQFLLQQLNQLAMQQLGLNQATQELLQKLSLQQQAEMARLAAQQELIRKSLQELMKEAEISGNRGKILGDLNKIAEEMKEVVSDLESNNLTEETIRKQDRILSRLLDAQRSIHERDFEKRRESRPGQDIVRESPPELNLQEDRDKIFQELLKAIREGYHRDYEVLIKKYIELLRSLQQ